MLHIGSKLVRENQILTFVTIFLWVLLCLPFMYFSNSNNIFLVFGVGLLLLIVFSFASLQIYEVSLKGDFIVLRNIFFNKKISISKFKNIEPVFWSPFVYHINLKDNQGYYFGSRIKLYLSNFNSIEESKRLEKTIRQYFEKLEESRNSSILPPSSHQPQAGIRGQS